MCLLVSCLFEFFSFFCSFDLLHKILSWLQRNRRESPAKAWVMRERHKTNSFPLLWQSFIFFFLLFCFLYLAASLIRSSVKENMLWDCANAFCDLLLFRSLSILTSALLSLSVLSLSLSLSIHVVFFMWIIYADTSVCISDSFWFFNFLYIISSPPNFLFPLALAFSHFHFFSLVAIISIVYAVHFMMPCKASVIWKCHRFPLIEHTYTSRNCQHTTTKVFAFKHGKHQNQFNGKKHRERKKRKKSVAVLFSLYIHGYSVRCSALKSTILFGWIFTFNILSAALSLRHKSIRRSTVSMLSAIFLLIFLHLCCFPSSAFPQCCSRSVYGYAYSNIAFGSNETSNFYISRLTTRIVPIQQCCSKHAHNVPCSQIQIFHVVERIYHFKHFLICFGQQTNRTTTLH